MVQRPKGPASITTSAAKIVSSLFAVTLIHIALDACQSDGITILWPFTSRRFAADLMFFRPLTWGQGPRLYSYAASRLPASAVLPHLVELLR